MPVKVFNVVRYGSDGTVRLLRTWASRESALVDAQGGNEKYAGKYTFHVITKKIKGKFRLSPRAIRFDVDTDKIHIEVKQNDK